MSYLGIDTSKDFTVNGMKSSKNKDGWYESEEMCIRDRLESS